MNNESTKQHAAKAANFLSGLLTGWGVPAAYRTQTGLARIVVRGKLSLQNPLEAKSDPAEAAYELSIVPNPLATFVSENLAG